MNIYVCMCVYMYMCIKRDRKRESKLVFSENLGITLFTWFETPGRSIALKKVKVIAFIPL